jgi:integrase
MSRRKANLVKVPGVRIWKRRPESAGARYKLTYRDPDTGRQRTVTASADRDLTVELAEKIRRRVERLRLGLAQPEDERYDEQDAVPIAEHLADWRRSMEAGLRDAKHVRQFHDAARDLLLGTPPEEPRADALGGLAERRRGSQVRPVRLEPTRWARVSQVTASKVFERVGRVRAGRSAATANRYLDAAVAFLEWGVRDDRWRRNPCRHLARYPGGGEKAVVRRAIEPEAIRSLLAATVAYDMPNGGRGLPGMTGAERSRLYRFAIATGLRRAEVRGVRVRDLAFGDKPGVWTRAATSKNGRRQFIPLAEPLAAELRAAVEGKAPDEPAVRCPANTARMLRADLARAGIPHETPEGRVDFHALRHTTGSLLLSQGVSPKAVQEHMRHSKITLTMDTYGHLMDADRSAVRAALPDFGSSGAAADH